MYFNNNVHGTQIALEVMQEFGVKHIVFSSTAATYGEPKAMPITEETPTNPKNPYGESKLMMEKIMKWCDNAYGMKYVALRYFNVAGAKKMPQLVRITRQKRILCQLFYKWHWANEQS